MAEFEPQFNSGENGSFEHTNWFTVKEAGTPASPANDAARTSIYNIYWQSIYFYIRRMGQGPEDAQDLAQEFFARLFEKNYLQSADREKGKFRSFLLTMLKRFLADEWDRAHRQKRGGGMQFIPLDAQDTEFRYRAEPHNDETPETLFERRWAASLLEQVLKRLEEECAAEGKSAVFQELKPFLTNEQESSCAEAARKLGITENNLKVTVHRLRHRCRELLREEIARTATSSSQVDEEIQDLFAALRGG
jgi:RNA polymerase sigma-70 factor (ECF subfamily)